MHPKVIFIDWDGTLSNSRFWERWDLNSVDQPKYRTIQQLLFGADKSIIQDWMRGWQSVDMVLRHISNTTSLSYKDLYDELRYSCEHMQFINDDITNIVQQIRRKDIKVVIATDNMDVFRQWTIPALHLDKLFDGVIISDSQAAFKNELSSDGRSSFFDFYFKQQAIPPNETVLIDNSLDCSVVEEIGMNFLHVTQEMPVDKHLATLL